MNHDFFCPDKYLEMPKLGCYYCEIILDVRNDATEKAIDVAVDQRSKFKAQDWDDAIEAVASALRSALPPLPPEMGGLHGEIPDTEQNRKFFNRLIAHDSFCEELWNLDGHDWEKEPCATCAMIERVRDDVKSYTFTPDEVSEMVTEVMREVRGSTEVQSCYLCDNWSVCDHHQKVYDKLKAALDDLSESGNAMIHDPLCNIVDGPCCPWMGDCTCQCNCDFIAEVRRDDRQRVQEGEVLEEYMCPFCVTPWKCNGPHIEQDDLEEFEAYVQDRIKEALDET